MKIFLLITLFLSSFMAVADVPPSIRGLFKRHVFVDFKQVHYEITVDLDKQEVTTSSLITFDQKRAGHIIFDLRKPCLNVLIDGEQSQARAFLLPGPMSIAKSISKKTQAGSHTMQIDAKLKRGVDFSDDVEIGLWIRDLIGRKFLEQYLPANFEYDQYQATMQLNIIGANADTYELMVNGHKSKTQNGFSVKFPDFYTSSSFFIHLFKKDTYVVDKSSFTRADGKKIDFITYSRSREFTDNLKESALKSLAELEALYGTWPHDFLIIFGDQAGGGMEHAGATQTSLGSLDHELHHSYFSKTVIPENGNAGWMDEAIVTWRDRDYPLLELPKYNRHNLACHSRYRRATDWDSYKVGGDFISHLAFLFNEKGIDFKIVLRNYYQQYKYQVVNTKTFREFLEGEYGDSLKAKFAQHVCNPRLFKRLRRGTNPY